MYEPLMSIQTMLPKNIMQNSCVCLKINIFHFFHFHSRTILIDRDFFRKFQTMQIFQNFSENHVELENVWDYRKKKHNSKQQFQTTKNKKQFQKQKTIPKKQFQTTILRRCTIFWSPHPHILEMPIIIL